MMQIKLQSVGRYLVGKELFACDWYRRKMRGKFTHRHKRTIRRRHKFTITSPLGAYETLSTVDMVPVQIHNNDTELIVEYPQLNFRMNLNRLNGTLTTEPIDPDAPNWDYFQIDIQHSEFYKSISN